MDKETLSNYGWIVICVMVLAVMLAFASPFGNFIAGAIKSTTQGLFDTNQNALDSAGIEIMEQEFDLMLNGTSQNNCPIKFGEPYSYAETEDYVIVYKFYEDGSIDMELVSNGEILFSDTAPAGSVGYNGVNLTDSSSGETLVIGEVSTDGRKINLDGMVLMLGEPCYHKNTEIKNSTDSYEGDLFCKDCGSLLLKGECSHANTEIRNESATETGELYCKDCNTILQSNSCKHLNTEIKNVSATYSGDTVCNDCGKTISKGSGIIPAGGKYYVGVTSTTTGDYTSATTVYGEGDYFPSPTKGDIFVYGDYEYRYTYYYSGHSSQWKEFVSEWSARVLDSSKQTYGPLLENINGKPLYSLSYTFYGCSSMTTAPKIPNSIRKIDGAFYGCKALKTYTGSSAADGDFSNFVIPNGISNMEYTFDYCEGIKKAPVLPTTVTSLYCTFYGCTNLTTAPLIPNGARDIGGIFEGCTSLETYVGSTAPSGDFSGYVIPSSVTTMYISFQLCPKVVIAPDLSKATSLTIMTSTFYGCTNLTTAPNLSNCSKLSIMDKTFEGCSNLKTYLGEPSGTVDGDFSQYCIPNSATNLSETFFGCKSLTKAPLIPENVTNMYRTFRGCTSLDGAITINATPTNFAECLRGTKITEIRGNCTVKDDIFATK